MLGSRYTGEDLTQPLTQTLTLTLTPNRSQNGTNLSVADDSSEAQTTLRIFQV